MKQQQNKTIFDLFTAKIFLPFALSYSHFTELYVSITTMFLHTCLSKIGTLTFIILYTTKLCLKSVRTETFRGYGLGEAFFICMTYMTWSTACSISRSRLFCFTNSPRFHAVQGSTVSLFSEKRFVCYSHKGKYR